jgi:hypothetical protein
MKELIGLFILLLLLCYLLWLIVAFTVLAIYTDRLAKMRGSISLTDGLYELTFWPITLHRLREFEAKE